LYLGDKTISSNYVTVLALHPESSECGYVEVCDSTYTRNLKKIRIASMNNAKKSKKSILKEKNQSFYKSVIIK
jgi:hypothetical protein